MVWAGFEYKVGGGAVKAALYSVSSAATEIRPRLIRTLWSQKTPTAQASKVATRLGHKCASAHTAQEEVCLKLWTEIN